VSSFFPRKGPDALLEAYGRAFSIEDPVTLVIKTFPNPHNRIHEQLRDVREKYPNFPHVLVIEEDLSDSALKALYQHCHVLVAPSCAEGFGLPLAEAMLSGLPVITTAWSGQMDFCTTDNAWLVDYCFEQADTHFNLRPSAWAAIDVDALASAMQEAQQSGPETLQAMAQRGRDLLLREFSWAKVADRLIDFYKTLQNGHGRSPCVGWISTWNAKCGIATYSEHLTARMDTKPIVLAARSDATLCPDDSCVVRCWDVGDDDNLSGLEQAIDERKLDVLVIQFNFGFFSHDYLYRFIKSQKDIGRVVVVDMHATIDPPQAPNKKLSNFAPALALADRLLMHSIADMNRLKSLGLADNLALFPHGILDYPRSVRGNAQVPTIATYGFCLPHKGLEEIVEAVGLMRDDGERVNLRMVNAEYPIDFSAQLADSLRQKVSDLGLNDQITIETRFLPDEESLALLQEADVVLFVYHPTSESASGAVRYGLAIGKPILVTDLPIFAEFGQAVWRVTDNSPALLAQSLRAVLEHVRSGSAEHLHRQQLAEDWCKQHQYSWLSKRLEGLLQGLAHSF
jgi:glycosyltransferase involved in cell wall biosynthesis